MAHVHRMETPMTESDGYKDEVVWGWESIQPYCECGRKLWTPTAQRVPTRLAAEVQCPCGHLVKAYFWRCQA